MVGVDKEVASDLRKFTIYSSNFIFGLFPAWLNYNHSDTIVSQHNLHILVLVAPTVISLPLFSGYLRASLQGPDEVPFLPSLFLAMPATSICLQMLAFIQLTWHQAYKTYY